MLSLFDRMDGHPAVEDDQRHVNLVLCPSEASTAFRAVPGIDIREPSWWFEVAQWSGGGCGAADRDPFRTRRNIAVVPASSKVAHMRTIKITDSPPCCSRPRFAIYLVLSIGVRRTRPGSQSVKVKGTSPSESADRTRRTATKSLIAETGAMARNRNSGAKLLSALAAEPRSHRHLTSAAVSGRNHALSNASNKSVDDNPVISTAGWVGTCLARIRLASRLVCEG